MKEETISWIIKAVNLFSNVPFSSIDADFDNENSLKEKNTMEKVDEERRNMSQGGLLDAAISTLQQLVNSGDMMTRSLAVRALADVQRARLMVPMRRRQDGARPR